MTRDEAVALARKHDFINDGIAAILEAHAMGRRSMQEEAAAILRAHQKHRLAEAILALTP